MKFFLPSAHDLTGLDDCHDHGPGDGEGVGPRTLPAAGRGPIHPDALGGDLHLLTAVWGLDVDPVPRVLRGPDADRPTLVGEGLVASLVGDPV